MKWYKLPLLLLIILISFTQPNSITAENLSQRLLIMFAESHDQKITQEQLISSYDGTIIERIPSLNAVAAEIPTHQLDKLTNNQAIKYIEQDHIVTVKSQTYPPLMTNVPTAPNQLGAPELEPESSVNINSTQLLFSPVSTMSTNWIDWGTEKIKAPQAWQQQLTGQGVKVAVIDTGIAAHPDLQIKKGVSFTDYTDSYEDDNGHGTHVAGTIAAGANRNGLKGISPDVELYAIKVLDKEGNGFHSTIIKGIEWAIEQNVDIINISVGGTDSSVFLEVALSKAYNDNGILIVGAAGNSGNTVEFPASYSSVIAVGATDHNDDRAQFSAHGDTLELVAPGVRVKSTDLNNKYKTMDGTSMAAPHVTGMLALLKQAQPSLSNEQLRTLIKDYTKDLGVLGEDSEYGFGRIEFPAQVEIELPPTPPTQPENVNLQKNKTEITLSWEHQTETTFYIYRDGKKIQEVTNEFFFTEQLTEGTYTYELTTVNEHQLESNKTVPSKITIEKQMIETTEDPKPTVEEDPEPITKTISDTAAKYTDVKETDWFMSPLHHLQSENLSGGYPDGTFRPNQYVTRAELAVFLGRVLQLNGTRRITVFPDVSESMYAAGFIQSAYESKLISGYPDGTFQPNQILTREEVAVFLTRAFLLKKQTPTLFPDVDPNHYTFQSIQLVVAEEIAFGYPDGTFKPKQGVTRAELVTFLSRAIIKFQ